MRSENFGECMCGAPKADQWVEQRKWLAESMFKGQSLLADAAPAMPGVRGCGSTRFGWFVHARDCAHTGRGHR